MTLAPIPLVFLPGLMCDARLFGPQIEAFSAQRSLHLPALTSGDTMATLAAAVLKEAPPRFALCGLSMGGILAMEVLRQAPERVERLALLDTNPRAETAQVQAGREPQIERALAGDLAGLMREALMPNYLAAHHPREAELLDLTLSMALALGPAVFERQSRALQTRPDQQETLRGLRIPTLVLMGEEDRLCPLDRHERMHALIPGSRLEIIPKTGHLSTLEAPEAVNQAIADWLAA